MKQSNKNTTANNGSILNPRNDNANENHLYNLLFAGKITLKEYFEARRSGQNLVG